MDDKLYYRELECYSTASESVKSWIGKNGYFDLALLPSETIKNEFAKYIRKRSEQISLNTMQRDKAYFNQCCVFFKSRKNLPDSLLGWEEAQWIQLLKAWMLQNGLPLTGEHTSIYGNTHRIDARLIGYLKSVIAFSQPEDLRPEHEKDIWHLDKLDISISENPIYKTATLTLQRDCLFQINGQDMIRIQQVKTNTFQKPVSAELAMLIQKAIGYTEQRYGETTYIFVDEKDTCRPLQYTTIKHKVLGLIRKENLRDDEGNPFTFGTHMFRRSYGVKLTEIHLDDWTIAKLLGHKGTHVVMQYRKMSNQVLADEMRKARAEQTRILLANIDGWGEDYEQIR